MENRAHALIAGIFVILLSTSVALVAMWFSGNNTKRTDYLVVTKESVSGLNPQSAVHYRGVNIGKVEKIQFDPDNPHQILIHIAVNENVILRKSVYAQLGYQGVTGLAYIQLNDDGVNNEILSDERIPMRRSLLDEVTGSGQDLLSNVNKLVLKMHHLLNEQNQNHISQILQNIDKATKNFDGRTIRRIIVCSGKIYYELLAYRKEQRINDMAIIRLEQLYPFPHEEFQAEIDRFCKAKEVIWCQEEPGNQGAWHRIQHYLLRHMRSDQVLGYALRASAASPAVGYMARHKFTQNELIVAAFRDKI